MVDYFISTSDWGHPGWGGVRPFAVAVRRRPPLGALIVISFHYIFLARVVPRPRSPIVGNCNSPTMHKATGASASEVREDSERLVSYSAKITAQNSAAGEIFRAFLLHLFTARLCTQLYRRIAARHRTGRRESPSDIPSGRELDKYRAAIVECAPKDA